MHDVLISKTFIVILQYSFMGITKTDLFTQQQNQLALYAKALGHPARIAILEHLLTANACINGDLVKELGLAQPTISQHLKALKEAGIIQGNIEGTRMNYCINPQCWQELQKVLSSFFNRFQSPGKADCC